MRVAEVAVERVAIVGEGGQHQVHPPVAVGIAGIDAHAGLRARLAIDRDAGDQPDAVELPVTAVAIQEVGVRVVGHEQVHGAIVVDVGGDDAEAVGARGIGQAVRGGSFAEASAAEVLEEQVGLARQAGRADHDRRAVAPAQRAPGAPQVVLAGRLT